MNSHVFPRTAIAIAAILVGFTTYAQAGPPLICHRIEIGQANSLPFINWNQKGSGGYDLKNLTRDTLAILDSNTPVLVRMETLRRASIYARQDPKSRKGCLPDFTCVQPPPLPNPRPWHGSMSAIWPRPTSNGLARANQIPRLGLADMPG